MRFYSFGDLHGYSYASFPLLVHLSSSNTPVRCPLISAVNFPSLDRRVGVFRCHFKRRRHQATMAGMPFLGTVQRGQGFVGGWWLEVVADLLTRSVLIDLLIVPSLISHRCPVGYALKFSRILSSSYIY